MSIISVRDVPVKGKRCFVRVDYNVPIKNGQITDDTKIRASLPTVRFLIEKGATVILASHLGRPGGKVVPNLKLDRVARALGDLLGQEVRKVDGCVGPLVEESLQNMNPCQVVLLENVRFEPGEEKNDPELARKMACLADIFVNDAFGTAHRAHASTAGIARYIPAYAGFLMEREIEALGKLLEDPERPFAAVIGGAKVSDKLGVLENLLDRVDVLLIGGGMANTFLLAQGYKMGKSAVEPGMVEGAREILAKAERLGKVVLLPKDLVVASAPRCGEPGQVVSVSEIPDDMSAFDIGPETRRDYSAKISRCKTVFWNGPMGVFEVEAFRGGTFDIAAAMAETAGFTVAGGGDTLAALELAGLSQSIGYRSTGGGASLEFLEGRTLPGIACLRDSQ